MKLYLQKALSILIYKSSNKTCEHYTNHIIVYILCCMSLRTQNFIRYNVVMFRIYVWYKMLLERKEAHDDK